MTAAPPGVVKRGKTGEPAHRRNGNTVAGPFTLYGKSQTAIFKILSLIGDRITPMST